MQRPGFHADFTEPIWHMHTLGGLHAAYISQKHDIGQVGSAGCSLSGDMRLLVCSGRQQRYRTLHFNVKIARKGSDKFV